MRIENGEAGAPSFALNNVHLPLVVPGEVWWAVPTLRLPRGGPACRFRAVLGFTLVELLVVVSIIALLIAILLPSLRKAREQAKCAVCLSNLHQMGLSLTTYALENRDHFPAAACGAAIAPEENYWLCTLQRCARQPLVSRCLNDKTEAPFLDWSNPPRNRETWDNYRWSSYAMNFSLVSTPQNPHEYNRLDTIRRPDSVIYLAEIRCGGGYDHGDHIHSDLFVGVEAPKAEVAWDRHDGRSNYLFVDSHVETLHWRKTWDYPSRNLWYPSHAPGWPPPQGPPIP